MPRARTVHRNEARSSQVEFKPIKHNVIEVDQCVQGAVAKPVIVFSAVTPHRHIFKGLQDRAPRFDNFEEHRQRSKRHVPVFE